MLREACKNDLKEILELYLFLHETDVPEESEHLTKTWDEIITEPNHHLIVCEVDGKIVSSCVCVIIPNLTGSKSQSTLDFYRNAGYNSSDKTAFIQWIGMEE